MCVVWVPRGNGHLGLECRNLKGAGGCRTVCCLLVHGFECILLFKMPLSHTKCYRNRRGKEVEVEAMFHHLLFERIDEYFKTIWQEAEDYSPASSPGAKATFLLMGSKLQEPRRTDSRETHTGIKGFHCLILWGLLG